MPLKSAWSRTWEIQDGWDNSAGGKANIMCASGTCLLTLTGIANSAPPQFRAAYPGAKQEIWQDLILTAGGSYPVQWTQSKLNDWANQGQFESFVDAHVAACVGDWNRRPVHLIGKCPDGIHTVVMFIVSDAYIDVARGRELLMIRVFGDEFQSGTGHGDPR